MNFFTSNTFPPSMNAPPKSGLIQESPKGQQRIGV
jgi:hypothetical protein